MFDFLLLIQSSVIYLKNVIYHYNFRQKYFQVFLINVSKPQSCTVNDI